MSEEKPASPEETTLPEKEKPTEDEATESSPGGQYPLIDE